MSAKPYEVTVLGATGFTGRPKVLRSFSES